MLCSAMLCHLHLKELHFIIRLPAESFSHWYKITKREEGKKKISPLVSYYCSFSESVYPSLSLCRLLSPKHPKCLLFCKPIGSSFSREQQPCILCCDLTMFAWVNVWVCVCERVRERQRESLEATSVLWPGYNVDAEECSFRSCWWKLDTTQTWKHKHTQTHTVFPNNVSMDNPSP